MERKIEDWEINKKRILKQGQTLLKSTAKKLPENLVQNINLNLICWHLHNTIHFPQHATLKNAKQKNLKTG